jgi:hypothetical protein
VVFSVHGAIAAHYGVDAAKLGESHAPLSITSSPRPRVDWSGHLDGHWKCAKLRPAMDV